MQTPTGIKYTTFVHFDAENAKHLPQPLSIDGDESRELCAQLVRIALLSDVPRLAVYLTQAKRNPKVCVMLRDGDQVVGYVGPIRAYSGRALRRLQHQTKSLKCAS